MKLVCLMVLCLAPMGGCAAFSGETPNETAEKWCSEMGYDCQHVSCVRADSDQNGYVSCTVRTDDDQKYDLECDYMWHRGCREVRYGLPPGLTK